ncbi:hypothetical protein [Tomitella fengzijianii]|uniref:Uncharacterized protein n=1 Tax=Tomitella fengzijianii TaxID=2597660 RepID=A0A516X894_9ACTN|nr:hypothetical protein [Tomitella fengzijianii]QDQ98861.1 hypothetical protein FO059_17805 [Tomitella fengzijianii]
MTDHCSPAFAELAQAMGFSCSETGGVVSFRSPFGLENWTLPVLGTLIIVGSVLALVYAIVRLRRHGDPTNLVLWFGALFFLFIIEPPIYFPATFGTEEYLGTMFAHNVFAVDFLWGRLPLYIVAIYPLMATTAFELVRMLGVFRRYGVFIGAACVGFVHHAFYEIFDQLGPQLRWWEWSADNEIAKPFLDAVPVPSIVVFAALWPMSLALCVQFFVGRHVDAGRSFSGPGLVWRTVVVGLLASVGVLILPMPATIMGIGGNGWRAAGYVIELAVIAVIAVMVLTRQWLRLRPGSGEGLLTGADAVRHDNPFVRFYAVVYLVVFAVLWASALPDYVDAVDGITANGDPIGNIWYTLACFAVAIAVVVAAWSVRMARSAFSGDGPGEPALTPTS